MKKKIAILGSTGSIGVSTLKVIQGALDEFQVIALSCGKNVSLFEQQIQKFHPKAVCVSEEASAKDLRIKFPLLEIVCGEKGLCELAAYPEVDLVVLALVGAQGIGPTWAAILAQKDIALANKEVLVAAGAFIMPEVEKRNIKLIPIDSEHSAIFQVWEAENKKSIRKITLTASGGPFLNRPKESFHQVKPEEALKHPRWSMGNRISVDSATLMNKGFEMIEAHWLFGMKSSQIEIVIHPESIIHSLITYQDGNTLASLSYPDMKAPIAYALSYPKRISTEVISLDLTKVKALTFYPPDEEKFPLLKTASWCFKEGGMKPCLLNAADEIAVEAFLKEKLSFDKIYNVVEEVLAQDPGHFPMTLEGILAGDSWGRQKAWRVIEDMLN